MVGSILLLFDLIKSSLFLHYIVVNFNFYFQYFFFLHDHYFLVSNLSFSRELELLQNVVSFSLLKFCCFEWKYCTLFSA